MKIEDAITAILYGVFLLFAVPFFLYWSSAIVDTLGVDRHLPLEATPILVVAMASLAFTGVALIPGLRLEAGRTLKSPPLRFSR
ncbi:hypothetical protein TEU_06995 [Thermococcus eurythermalis]|uniref:Uncharacterized protein n=1 Tax=Thermococcus eurythermalis TaxID=1505907 RepID=A0A097QUE3_9EURY|nr:hypothetical protein [Thermococcus eurythermalis]AIU70093.1 hypothetical protein TEU_06995 [Thermococcus eurythermalis]